MVHFRRSSAIVAFAGLACTAFSAEAGADTPAGTLPITEVTAFKDGHALVLRTGRAALDGAGDVLLTDVPAPVLGTFWASTGEAGAKLAAVTASLVEVEEREPASSPAAMLEANVGRRISIRTGAGERIEGVLKRIVESKPDAVMQPQGQPYWNGYQWIQPPAPPPQSGPVEKSMLIDTGSGVSVVPLNQASEVRFLDADPATEVVRHNKRERLSLDLAWAPVKGERGPDAAVSLMYLQRGLRWIPSYRVTMLEGGKARLELQATLVNELADLKNVRLHAAIGVPSFAFEHTPDPIGMRDALPSLGLYFQQAQSGQTGAMLSNAIMAQSARMSEGRAGGSGGRGDEGGPSSPELSGSERAEDLYVFTVEGVTLAKGARMVLPLASYEVPAASVYTVDLPAAPPAAALQNFNTDQQRELARLLDRPVARHVLRLTNENAQHLPITTAPALVVKDGRTLAQGLMTYGAPGAKVDLEVGAAVDIGVEQSESETGRKPDAITIDNNGFVRVDMAFNATITNRKPHAVTVEVTKRALGASDGVGHDGKAEAMSFFSDAALFDAPGNAWWRWYGWPWWWHRMNPSTKYAWTVTLKPGEEVKLDAKWHYFWD